MKIASVEAIPVHARMAKGDVYWGNQSWGHNKAAKKNAPGLPPGNDRSQFPYFWRSRAASPRTASRSPT